MIEVGAVVLAVARRSELTHHRPMSTLVVSIVGIIGGFVLAAVINTIVPGLIRIPLKAWHPVHVHVESDPAVIYAGAPNWVTSAWITDDALELEQPPTNVCREWRSWLWPRGVFDADHTEIVVTIQGAVDAAVTIDGLRARVVRREPLSGRRVACSTGGAEMSPRHVLIDLDFEPGMVLFTDDDGEVVRKSFALRRGESEQFHVKATAKECRSSTRTTRRRPSTRRSNSAYQVYLSAWSAGSGWS